MRTASSARWVIAAAVALFSIAVAAQTPAPADPRLEQYKRELAADIDGMKDFSQQMVDSVFSFGELGFQEYETGKYLTGILEKNGFRIERGVAGIPTAWTATWGSGTPVIALGSDIDCIPQASQKPGVAYHDPMIEGAPGHGEGHNSGVPMNVTAALALKKVMERNKMPGTIRLWPGVAEELLAGKAYFVRAGVFKDVDVVLFAHVGANMNVGWGEGAGTGLVSVEYSFKGESAHAAAAPARGRSALDAVELMDIGWNFRREHLRLQQRSHYVITNGGDQPNVVPSNASVWYYFRETDYDHIKELWELGNRMSQAAAMMTDTQVTSRVLGSAWPVHSNKAVAEAMYANIQAVGLPQWSADDEKLATALQRELKVPEVGLAKQIPPLRGAEKLPDEQRQSGGSDDIGDVSWNVPTVTLGYPANFSAGPGHSWANAVAMATPIAHKGVTAGAKVQAMTALDLVMRPELVAEAWAYFKNVQTKDRQYTPLIRPADVPPTWLNEETMAKYRPEMRKFYYDPTKYKTYLEQLGIETDGPVRRRTFLQAAGAVLVGSAAPRAQTRAATGAYDAFEKSIGGLQADMTSGATTSVALVRFYRRRIDALDQTGPRLNTVIALNPQAEAVAASLDAERRRGRTRGPLHGIPVLLKDNLDTRDMPTTGGCLALSGHVPREDAFQVRRLREAGAVILGKVNLHELALGLTTVSSLGGQTLNPYDLARAPGGSSGGSGVAAAANFAAFTMGTDTSGSIRIPASHNAIVGLRPSAGLSSRSGVIPFGHSQDTAGPMARTVTDIALVLDATVGPDPADPVTSAGAGKAPSTYTTSLRRDALRGARIGVLTEFFGSAPEDQPVAAVVRRAIDDMKAAGATPVDVTVPKLGALLAASNLLTQELKFDLRDYLRRAPAAAVTSLEALLASGLHTAQFQAFIEGANALPDDYPGSDDYTQRLEARDVLRRAVVEVMDANRLDAIVYPTARRIAPLVGGNQLGSNAGLSAQSGCPAITVPAGAVDGGFPVGVELLGRPFAEPMLLGLAFAYEQATHHRRPPASAPRVVTRPARREPAPVPNGVRIDVEAAGPFRVSARLVVDEPVRRLSYTLTPGAARDQIAGVYLHRRANRPNGGVAYILTKRLDRRVSGAVTLLNAELADLKAGKCYLAAVSRQSPLVGVRADIVWPTGRV